MLINRLLLIIWIVISGIFASLYGGNITYALFYTSLTIPVIAFLYTFYVFTRFKMYQSIYKRTVVKGEITQYVFRLSNEDVLPYQNIKVDFFDDKSTILGSNEVQDFSLIPGETQSLDTSICCNYRGEYYIGAKSVTITDFLYLFSVTYPVFSKLRVRVYPRIVSISNVKMITANMDSKRSYNRSSEEQETDIEVRKYISGDNRKRIHWKASAKKQELLTRKYISIPKIGVAIFMDLSRVREDDLTNVIVEDKIIESTIALVDYSLRKQIPCEVLFDQNGIQQVSVQNQVDFDGFYNQCVEIRFAAEKKVEGILEESRIEHNQSFQHIIITHNITEDLFKRVLKIVGNGNECGIIYIKEHLNSEMDYLVRLIIGAGVKVTIISHNDEIAEVL